MKTETMMTSPVFWQSDIWKTLLEKSSYVVDTQTIELGGERVFIEYRSLGGGCIGAFSLGFDIETTSADLLDRARSAVLERGALFWQTESYHPGGVDPLSVVLSTYGRAFLEPWTRILDLEQPSDQLLSEMHEKGRYNIRLAQKRGVTLEWVDPSEEYIDIWMQLLDDTTMRDRFSSNTREYYRIFLDELARAHAGGLLIARYQDQVIAAGIYVYTRDTALYYYGASTSSSEMRKHMAPYLLQWEAICEAKRRGCRYYDFLGIAPPESPGHHLEGVTAFKERFGGRAIMIGSKHIMVFAPIRYTLLRIIRGVRNMRKRH